VFDDRLGDEHVFPEVWVQDTFKYSQPDADAFQRHVDEYKEKSKTDYSACGNVKAYQIYWYIIDQD